MSFKDIWRPRIDGVDDADSSAVNEIAEAVINNENFINDAPNKYYNKESVNNLFANALKGSASGEAVALKDVSPLEHNLGVRVESKNLLDYTNFYTDFDSVVGYTLNEDKTLSFSGTASGLFQYNFFYDSNNPIVCTEDMFVSGCPSGGAFETYCLQAFVILPNGTQTYSTEYGEGMVVPKGSKIERVFAIIRAGVNVDGLTFEPMLIKGTKKKPYTPYIADTSGVKLKVQGANIFKYIRHWSDTCTYENGVVTQLITDTATILRFMVKNGSYENLGASDVITSTGRFSIPFVCNKEEQNIYIALNGSQADTAIIFYDVNLPVGTYVFSANLTNMTQGSISWKDMQIALVDTDYEPYKEPIEYAQGEDIKSIYPTTTIMTDTAGAVLTVEYNKDANKVVKSLEDRISALEAMIVSQ